MCVLKSKRAVKVVISYKIGFMIIWVSFLLLQLSILFISSISKYKVDKVLWIYASILILTFFSAFRDGLGTDYEGYLEKLSYSAGGTIKFLSEPFFQMNSNLIQNTNLSPVFFFFITSIITVPLLCSFLMRKNDVMYSSLVIFILFPTLYFNTFNLVRQFFSAAIFLFAIRYINDRKCMQYLLCIVLACTMHLSSIVLFPLYFFLDKRYSLKIYLLLLLLFVLAAFSIDPILQNIQFLGSRYSLYAESDEQLGSSLMVLLYNVVFVVMLIKKSYFNNDSYSRIIFNLQFLLVIFSDLALINYFFYRLSVYFIPVIAITLPKTLYILFKNKVLVTTICLALGLYLFLSLTLFNLDNPIVCPDTILPISSLLD